MRLTIKNFRIQFSLFFIQKSSQIILITCRRVGINRMPLTKKEYQFIYMEFDILFTIEIVSEGGSLLVCLHFYLCGFFVFKISI